MHKVPLCKFKKENVRSVKCKTCDKVFCCSSCCFQHEMKTHGIVIYKETNANVQGEQNQSNNSESIYLCPICQKCSFPLTTVIPNEILKHIEQQHLPLQCVKCLQLFKNMDDLKEFTKCFKNSSTDHNYCMQPERDDMIVSPPPPLSSSSLSSSLTSGQKCKTNELCKITVKRSPLLPLQCKTPALAPPIMTQTISTQTTPTILMQQENQIVRTPSNNNNDNKTNNVLMMNCTRLKVKTSKTSYTHFSSDHSVSSIRNLSSLSNHSASLKKSIVETSLDKKKIIRSTSTPLQFEMVKVTDKSKPSEHTFGVAGSSTAQISSICAADSDASASASASGSCPNASIHQPSISNEGDGGGDYQYRKTMAISNRTRMFTVTPLRHVMSKNMHKAIATHNLVDNSSLEGGITGDIRDYCCLAEYKDVQIKSTMPQALDLRLSPVKRRSKEATTKSNEVMLTSSHGSQSSKIVLSAQKITTESIVITTQTKHMAASINYDQLNAQSRNAITTYRAHRAQHLKTCTNGLQIMTTNANMKNQNENEYHSNNNNIKTPIARIPGAVINKKLIKFDESPEIEEYGGNGKNYNNNDRSRNSSSDSNSEIFFTPNTTPNNNENKMKHRQALDCGKKRNDSDNKINQEVMKPNLKYCAHSTAFSCIENCNDDDNDNENYDDDVFIKENDENRETKDLKQVHDGDKQMMNKMAAVVTSAVNVGSLWSALMSSVTRFSSTKTAKSSETKNITYDSKRPHTNTTTKSILQKCASIVTGTLMKPLKTNNEMRNNCDTTIKPLKRKRPSITSTERSCEKSSNFLSSISSSISPSSSDLSHLTAKRFRIQGRRPLYRLRFDT